jgi:hypothetical protein
VVLEVIPPILGNFVAITCHQATLPLQTSAQWDFVAIANRMIMENPVAFAILIGVYRVCFIDLQALAARTPEQHD